MVYGLRKRLMLRMAVSNFIPTQYQEGSVQTERQRV